MSGCTLQGPAQILCLVATEPLPSGGGGDFLDTHHVQQGSRAPTARSQHHTCTEQVVGGGFWVGTAIAASRADSRLCHRQRSLPWLRTEK